MTEYLVYAILFMTATILLWYIVKLAIYLIVLPLAVILLVWWDNKDKKL